MQQTDLIEKIKGALNEVHASNSQTAIKNHLQNAARSLNLIETNRDLFLRYSADLLQMISAEVSFQKLNNKTKEPFSDSFFRSFEILKKEIFQALQNLSK